MHDEKDKNNRVTNYHKVVEVNSSNEIDSAKQTSILPLVYHYNAKRNKLR